METILVVEAKYSRRLILESSILDSDRAILSLSANCTERIIAVQRKSRAWRYPCISSIEETFPVQLEFHVKMIRVGAARILLLYGKKEPWSFSFVISFPGGENMNFENGDGGDIGEFLGSARE